MRSYGSLMQTLMLLANFTGKKIFKILNFFIFKKWFATVFIIIKFKLTIYISIYINKDTIRQNILDVCYNIYWRNLIITRS